ncbi:hypothetical protein GPY51_14505 [Photorhabdus laumondii subsp. laumondii]|uniref:Uncharacterized protein n=1 Tax=Photorhabdus laumondii subsp. laumondii TaxID=141679 RepID=A0A6L9JPP0_PHOLM|nr:hypothetical protein [Photorhabdus laumondii]MCC8383822.1 hypothetical protein [Photorhabdus laumondii]MCC8414498.1 hypothetical protein [Photorhabdus laumondii]NDK95616.1 hypothetical protein [Photorhabdus laumondii subsp. laumondii]NDL21794.1 hypothetical protein [Photorhabdus laumondii subsp. laumondii]NDL30760.1 hypothetical protein [Photorhabdus laumondii subsp. laumondii]
MITHKLAIFILCLSPAVCFSQPDKLPPGSYELVIGARPSMPYSPIQNYNQDLTRQGTGHEFTVSVSRHHIIPFNRLRSFYNRVVENNRLRNISSFLSVYSNNLGSYASRGGIDCNQLGSDIIDASNLGLAQGSGWIRGGSDRFTPGFSTFEQFYAWLPGNLFIGPNNRSDDPGSEFESNAAVVVGNENFALLSRLNRNMRRYVEEDDGSVLNGISADLSRLAQIRGVYSLQAQDWEYVNGRYRLRRDSKESFIDTTNSYDDYLESTCDDLRPTFDKIKGRYVTVINN